MARLQAYHLKNYARADFPFFVDILEEPPLALHTHDFYELAVVIQGTVTHLFENQDAVLLTPGSFVMLHPHERHGYEVGRRQPILMNCLFSSTFVASLGHGLGQSEILPGFFARCRAGSCVGSERRKLLATCDELHHAFTGKETNWRLATAGIFLQLIARLGRILGRVKENQECRPYSRLTPVTAYIDGHFHEELSLDRIGDLMGLHPNYVSGLFRRSLGMTFRAYLQARRLDYALHQLRHGSQSVMEICLQSGFHDLTHFERLVRGKTGQRPSELRPRGRRAGS